MKSRAHTPRVYMDTAATTKLDSFVLRKMLPFLGDSYGNPSSLHAMGREAKKAIESARTSVASALHAEPDEIIFTGSGTESDNFAILGVCRAYKNEGKHLVVSNIEHKAVLESAHQLEKEGFDVSYAEVDEYGVVSVEELKKHVRDDTILVSVMYANNEIGTVEPIRELAAYVSELRGDGRTPLFHTDACQAAGALPLHVRELGVDLMTLNGGKIYGPKGIGCLYRRKGVRIEPLILGGGQEGTLRGGTENVASIVGFSEALKRVRARMKKENARLIKLRDFFIRELLRIPDSRLNGHPKDRLPNNVNVSFFGIEGEAMLLMLDKLGVCASTGSACASMDLVASHVLLAIGLPPEFAHGSLRFTMGKDTKKKDVDYVLSVLPGIVQRLRDITCIRK